MVLLAMDREGLATFTDAQNDGVSLGISELEHRGVTHEFVMEAGAADVVLGDELVVWRLDRAKAVEIIEDLSVMRDADGTGHNYVDISTPTNTLVLSRDEFIQIDQ